MARKLKQTNHKSTVASITDAFNTLKDELGEEMRSWYDNMSENLQGGDKGTQVDEAAQALEDLNEPDIPEHLLELPIEYTTEHKGGRKGDPRWLRRDNEVAVLNAAISAVEDFVGQASAELLMYVNDDDDKEITVGHLTLPKGEFEELIEEAHNFLSELGDETTNAENVEFPGMYG